MICERCNLDIESEMQRDMFIEDETVCVFCSQEERDSPKQSKENKGVKNG